MESGETPQIEKIVETVITILKEADLEEATELNVRIMAADRLGIDPCELGYKSIVRRCVESYLLSLDEEEDKFEELHQGLEQDQGRVMCKFPAFSHKTNKPNTLVEEDKVEQHQTLKQDGGRVITETESRIRSKEAGKQMETEISKSAAALPKGLSPMGMKEIEQDIFNSVTASAPRGVNPMATKQIEADVSNARTTEVKADLSKAERKQSEADISNAETSVAHCGLVPMGTKQIEADNSNSVTTSAAIKGVIPKETNQIVPGISNSVTASIAQGVIPLETKQIEGDVSNAEATQNLADIPNSATKGDIANLRKQLEADISDAVSAFGPQRLLPITTTRLDGKNYYSWAHQMEIILKRLEIAYVLTDRCPSIPDGPKTSFEEIARAKADVLKWVDDDRLCRHSILNCLSDNIFDQYYRKTWGAKELWEEIKSAYYEDFGTKRSEVNKYIQFQMVDGIPVLEQVQELCRIGNSVVASGTLIDEYFHVSAIISKLPPTWKEYRAKLMREEFITLIQLMYRLRIEEESRNHAVGEGFTHMGELRADTRLGPNKTDFKRPAVHSEMEKGNKFITCFRCGQRGHISRNCQRRMVYVREKSIEENEVGPAVEPKTARK